MNISFTPQNTINHINKIFGQTTLSKYISQPICFKGNLNCDVFESQKPDIYTQNPTDKTLGIPEDLFKSKTMEKLYSPEFKPKRRFDKDGNPITTVIDKKTGKPVNVIVKKIPCDKQNRECWAIYDKKSKEPIGERSFIIDNFDKIISPGVMTSDGNEKYAGIGLRCHQIAVERMMQNNFKTVEIDSVPEAFAFHYKSGFRVKRHKERTTNVDVKNQISKWCYHSKLPREEIEATIVARKDKKGNIYFDNKSQENYMKLLYMHNLDDFLLYNLPMTLQGKHLEEWKNRAKSQPILLSDEEINR